MEPIPILVLAVTVLAFEALLVGSQLAEVSIPRLEQPTTCDFAGGGFFAFLTDVPKAIGCAIGYVINFVRALFGVIVLVFNLLTFNLPGAPWYVRLPFGMAIGGSLSWAVVSLVRGVRA